MATTPLAIISADKEIIELARDCGTFDVIGCFDPSPQADALDVPVLGSDSAWNDVQKKYPGIQVALALDPTDRKFKAAQHFGLNALATLLSPDAYVSPTAQIGQGCLVQRGVKVMASAHIGVGCKVNVNVLIHHDSHVGSYCTLAPTSLLLGRVVVEERVFVGAGAILLPGIRVGKGAMIGAGAVVVQDVAPGTTVAGVPAKPLQKANV